MDLDKTKKPRSEDEERVWMQYCDTLLRTAARPRGMEKRKGLEVGWNLHRMALAMIKSDGWQKYWMIRRQSGRLSSTRFISTAKRGS